MDDRRAHGRVRRERHHHGLGERLRDLVHAASEPRGTRHRDRGDRHDVAEEQDRQQRQRRLRSRLRRRGPEPELRLQLDDGRERQPCERVLPRSLRVLGGREQADAGLLPGREARLRRELPQPAGARTGTACTTRGTGRGTASRRTTRSSSTSRPASRRARRPRPA